MQDKELYDYILGLNSLWRVEYVKFAPAAGEIRVHVEHLGETPFCCYTMTAGARLGDVTRV